MWYLNVQAVDMEKHRNAVDIQDIIHTTDNDFNSKIDFFYFNAASSVKSLVRVLKFIPEIWSCRLVNDDKVFLYLHGLGDYGCSKLFLLVCVCLA